MPETATALLTIDLDAVVANWRLLRDRSAPAECAAVVKANGYGLGVGPVSKALAAAGCDRFFVATIDEGIELRGILPSAIIHVLCGPLPGTAGEFTAHHLIPVLNSLPQIAEWREHGVATQSAHKAVLHVDTGMCRLGLDDHDLGCLSEDPDLLLGIRPGLVMSHMACADEPASAMNQQQLAAFILMSAILPKAPRSLAASSTIFLGPEYHFELVRPGAALYGINPTPGSPNPMRPVVRLEGRVLQVRDVDSPMTVGYGASHRVTRKGRVATVAVGYADGWFRALGNRGHGLIGGEPVPVLGRISMDLTTVDVSALPEHAVQPGAPVVLIGPGRDVDAVAAESGTIGYEILTALGARSRRHYIGGAG